MSTPPSHPSSSTAGSHGRGNLYSQNSSDREGGRCYPSPPSSRASSGPSSPQCSTKTTTSPPRSSRVGPASLNRTPTPTTSRPTSQSPRRSRIEVASLLAGPEPRTYRLQVVQQPRRAAEFKMGNLSRLPVTPTIIVQLLIRDSSGNCMMPEAELPFLIGHLSLYSEDGTKSLDMGSQIGKANQATTLYGNLVSSVEVFEDLQGKPGLFLVFPDVSVRWAGRYQLGITLTRISGPGPTGDLGLAESGTQLGHIRTEAFEVLPQTEYTAAPPTPLTKSFIRQGARFNYMV